MVVIQRSKFGVKITEVYFSDGTELPKFHTDVVMYVFADTPGTGLSELRTLIIDLKRDEEELLRDCSKTTRYSIRRAGEKDNLSVELLVAPKEDDITDFFRFYSVFAGQKDRPMISVPKIAALIAAESLAISLVKDEHGAALCYHAHLVDSTTRRLMRLYSATHHRGDISSSEKSLIGRASRYLTWMDFLSFKNLGFLLYDMGGVPSELSDHELQKIGDFKRTFGGTERLVYSGFRPATLLGRLACYLVAKKVSS